MNIEAVAWFHSPMKEKFGIPRQAGLVPALRGEVRFVKPYDSPEAVRGLCNFDYCWLLWGFSLNAASPVSLTVRPPRLGGNERVGVFASRSPFRPNPLGLSCVKIESVGKGVIEVSGADLADGSPIYDIKPYLAYADSRPLARCGFIDSVSWQELEVEIPDNLRAILGDADAEALGQVLSQDPRPAYRRKDGTGEIYGLVFGEFNVRFSVDSGRVFVHSVEKY